MYVGGGKEVGSWRNEEKTGTNMGTSCVKVLRRQISVKLGGQRILTWRAEHKG